MKSISSRAIAAFMTLVFVTPVCAGVAVIGNRSLGVNSLSLSDVSRIYLGKSSVLGDGTYVIPIDQSVGTAARDAFYANVIKMTEVQAKAYWARVIFTGKGQPPQQESSDSAVKELVAQNPSFIGYIDESAVDGQVKVLARVK